MELKSIEIYDFRQFEAFDGKPQKITFARPGDRNVTAVYGTNGAGKSGLLNAFTWCLFGKTTKALKHPWNLVNQNAAARLERGRTATARVCIEFDTHVGGRTIQHRLQREYLHTVGSPPPADPQKAPPPPGRATLWRVIPGEGTQTMDDPTEISAYIEQVLPDELFQYFFIDGERIADLAKFENERDVRNAIEVFVGLRELIDGARHLRAASEIFDEELRRHERANDELKQLDDKIAAKERDATQLREEMERLAHTLEQIAEETRNIDQQLDDNKETHALEEQRKNLHQQLTHRSEELNACEAELFLNVVQNGWTAFALGVASEYLSANLEMRRRGQLPYNIRRPFIEELLQRLECMCGRTLDVGAVA